MVWCSHFFKNFPQFVVIHRVKDFSIVNEPEVDVFLDKIEKKKKILEFEDISVETKKQREKILGTKAKTEYNIYELWTATKDITHI